MYPIAKAFLSFSCKAFFAYIFLGQKDDALNPRIRMPPQEKEASYIYVKFSVHSVAPYILDEHCNYQTHLY
jgi:hypothetical protein